MRQQQQRESKGEITKRAENYVKTERCRGEERDIKMKLDRREAERLRDRSNLSQHFDLDLYGLATRCGVSSECLTHKLPNGPEDLLSALNAECPSMIPQPLSRQHPSTVT